MKRALTGRLITAALVALAAVPASLAIAQDGAFGLDDGPKATFEAATPEQDTVAAGRWTRVNIPISIIPEWHIYGLAEPEETRTRIEIDEWPAGVSLGAVRILPEAHEFATGDMKQWVHEGDVEFSFVVHVADDAPKGEHTINGVVKWMACNDRSCDPPEKTPFSFELVVEERGKAHLGDVVVEPAQVSPGRATEIRLPVAIDDTWHIYGLAHDGIPTEVEVEEWPDGLSAGPVKASEEAREYDNFGLTELIHEGDVTFTLGVNVAADAKPGPRLVQGVVKWMACDPNMCLSPVEVPFEVTIVVASADVGAASGAEQQTVGGDDTAPKSPGLGWGLIVQAIGLGLLTIITPCVFPMLPITVSFFSKQKGPALPRSLVYGAGWIVTIVLVGLIFKSGLDAFARGWVFNLFAGGLFLMLALSLFGMFDLRLPGFLSDFATNKSSSGGYVGAFFMAVTLAITSFSCSLPFLALMFEQFEGGAYFVAIVGLTVYATTLAAPFVLCSLFPAMLSTLPRAGAWMNAVKVTMGFVELGFAFKFLRTVDLQFGWGVLPRSLVLAIWVACAIGAGLYLLGYIVLPHDTKVESIGVVRLCFAVMFLSFGIYFVPGVFGFPLNPQIDAFIQTQESELIQLGGGGSEKGHLAWVRDDWDGSLARGVERNTPVLFDFTGVG